MSFGEKYPCMFQLIKQSKKKNVLSSSWFSPSLCFSSVSLLVPALHLCDFSPAATCTLLHWSTNQPPAGYIPALHSIISHIVQLANVFQIQRTASSSVFFLCYQACQSCPLFHIHSQAQGPARLSFLLHLKQFPCSPPHAHPGNGTVQQIQFNCSFCWSPAFGSHSASLYSELLTKTYLHIFFVCVVCPSRDWCWAKVVQHSSTLKQIRLSPPTSSAPI